MHEPTPEQTRESHLQRRLEGLLAVLQAISATADLPIPLRAERGDYERANRLRMLSILETARFTISAELLTEDATKHYLAHISACSMCSDPGNPVCPTGLGLRAVMFTPLPLTTYAKRLREEWPELGYTPDPMFARKDVAAADVDGEGQR